VSSHPDAKLIELGRQFDKAKSECIVLNRETDRLWPAQKAALAAAGFEGEDAHRQPGYWKARRRIGRQTGYGPASKVSTAKHGEAIKLMKAIHRTKATTLEGFAVKVAAVAFDQSDFEVSDPVPTDVAERMLYRLARDMAKAVKAGGRKTDPLLVLIHEYRKQMAINNAVEDVDLADEDALAEATFRPSYERLCNNPPAATSFEGAIAAIKLVADEEETCGGQADLTVNLLRAALVFLEGSPSCA
jgi:hypothetical protein